MIPLPPLVLVSVALPLPLFRTFAYEVDESDAARATPGMRVVVPFRNRREIGVVIATGATLGAGIKAKRVLEIPDQTPVLDAKTLELCEWISTYYAVPLGIAIRSAIPAALTGATDPSPSQRSRRVAVVRQEMPSLMHRDRVFARAKKQRSLFELIESLGGRVSVEHLTEQMKFAPSVLQGLVKSGLIEIQEEIVARDPFARRATGPAPAHAPTDAQRTALERLTRASDESGGGVFLVHGVTGSGKTLVYIELLRHVVNDLRKTAIVLVPEIALTPQTVDRFRAVFGDRVAVLHSALSEGERYDAWLALSRGEKQIVVGARSAIFAPLANLGAVIVDEEHESSYKQGEAPRYHAREVAIVRAKQHGAIVVLGSATPSLESWQNAETGKYTLLSLPERAGGGTLPRVDVVDRRLPAGMLVGGSGTPPVDPARLVLSEELETAVRDTLARSEQTILLLNRRGYASFVQCGECGNVEACPNCSISLTYHRAPERLICHYCQHSILPPSKCTRCGGVVLRQRGLGTQQVERLLAERFASARIARMDVDTTSAKWAHAEILDRVGSGEVDILMGTQMIAKGLDFPNVTLVGVIDADVGINLPDFRASERCFQLLSQVAGRAGRGPRGGRVIIQTRVPGHHAVRCAVSHDYHRFVAEELGGRREPRYPPFVRLANVVFSATTDAAAEQMASRGSDWLRALIARRSLGGLTIVGPSKCPVERIKNRWRWHFIIKSDRPTELTRVGRFFMERFDVGSDGEPRVTWDRDPVALM